MEKAAAEAQRRAEDLIKQLKAGAKFEDLARKYSEDPGSAKEGGSLGWIGKGRTVPEFEEKGFLRSAHWSGRRLGEEQLRFFTLCRVDCSPRART